MDTAVALDFRPEDTIGREMDAVAGAGGLQVLVVVGVLVVGLQQVVIDVLGAEIGLHPVQAQCFEFEHRHGAGGVLQQGVVDADGDLFAGYKLPSFEVRCQNLDRKSVV